MTITHVCLSDLHLGSETSLLTALDGEGNGDYGAASPVLQALVHLLRDLLPEGMPRPKLVLAGDVLEMALARTDQAAMTFRVLMAQLFPRGKATLFDPEILYVPGNHDHHLWETTRERQYLDYLGRRPDVKRLGEEWHVTRIYPKAGEPWPTQRLLTGLLPRGRKASGLTVSTVYPNLGLPPDDAGRTVVFTHGHFVEPLYRGVSLLQKLLFETPVPIRIEDLEAENFAWIDFFWSTLGRSGDAGPRVEEIYEQAGSPEGRKALGERLARVLVTHLPGHGWPVAEVTSGLLGDAVARLADFLTDLERRHTEKDLSDTGEAGLKAYVNDQLWDQIGRERAGQPMPEHLTVVFGHTHKPFARFYDDIPAPTNPVDVFNTGGWVVDTVEREPFHGASLVVIEDDVVCAALRLYNEVPEGSDPPAIRVEHLGDPALRERLTARLDAGSEAFAAFPAVAQREVEKRAEYLRRRIQGGASPPR